MFICQYSSIEFVSSSSVLQVNMALFASLKKRHELCDHAVFTQLLFFFGRYASITTVME